MPLHGLSASRPLPDSAERGLLLASRREVQRDLNKPWAPQRAASA